MSFGLEGAYVNKGIDYSSLVFGDQIESLIKYDIFITETDDEVFKHFKPNANYLDLSTGALFNLKIPG